MYLKRFFNDLIKYRKYLVYSAKASLKSEVAGSYLAWFWWILEPFCFMLIYKFIAETVFNKNLPFAALFVFLGLTVWNFFNKNISSTATLLKHNKGIITKIYLPKYLLCIRQILINGFKMTISLAICFALAIYYKISIDWHILLIIPSLIMLVLNTFGFGCLVMHFGVYIQDLSNIVRIVLRLVFYLSGVFYNIGSLKPYGPLLLNINPVALAMEGCRNALIFGKGPDWVMLGIWTAVGIVTSILGIMVVYKNENNYGKIL
jgi:ABC-type polysaccharide/polyol phosphate export permease